MPTALVFCQSRFFSFARVKLNGDVKQKHSMPHVVKFLEKRPSRIPSSKVYELLPWTAAISGSRRASTYSTGLRDCLFIQSLQSSTRLWGPPECIERAFVIAQTWEERQVIAMARSRRSGNERPWFSADQIAAKFFADQVLPDQIRRVACWVSEILASLKDENVDAHLEKGFLYDVCVVGRLMTIISHRQGVWLYKTIARERTWGRTPGYTFTVEEERLGSWAYREAVPGDPYERMTFTVDPLFFQKALLARSTITAEQLEQALALAKAYIENEEYLR